MPSSNQVRALALVGPTGAGKTTLLEAMLLAGEGGERRGVSRITAGDASPEARARGHSVELNIAGFSFLDDRYVVVDCPGGVEFAAERDFALPAMDAAVVVIDADPAKAMLLKPFLKELEAAGVPRALFVNKIDQAKGSLQDVMAILGEVSAVPFVARQIPIWENGQVSGFIDLSLERAFAYHAGEASERIALPEGLVEQEKEARFRMLEQLADHDDELMEQLLSDLEPPAELVFADLTRETHDGLIVPVFFGSALNGFGVRRLLKALRHETSAPADAAERLGLKGLCAYVLKTSHAEQAGKLAYARVFGGSLPDGAEFNLAEGAKGRAGGLFSVRGSALKRVPTATEGDVVAIAKVDRAVAGGVLAVNGASQEALAAPPSRTPVYALGIAAKARNDDVRLSTALTKLLEEDPGLSLSHDPETHQVLLQGQGEAHLQLTLERLKRRFGVDVTTAPPVTPYKETISKPTTQRSRHKKQTGGHGQFGEVEIEIKPRPRGAGFAFASRITGGVVPKQWIPAVEQGVRDALTKGPLGFPVVDLEVTLTDGRYHSVDSSEMAFRAAGRLAAEEGLAKCGQVLLEPIEKVTVLAPSSCTSNIISALSARRGHILGFDRRDSWRGWERIEATLPQSERHDLIAELRGLSQGLATFEASFERMAELDGRLAGEVAAPRRSA